MQLQVYDFRWFENEENPQNFFCELQANNGQKFGRRKLWIGDNLSIEVKSETTCAGAMVNNEWRSCPKHSVNKQKCEYCRAIEGGFVFTSFDGFDKSHLTPNDLEKIRGEHLIYLAFFGEEMIKIGVSKISRKFLRQAEQGSAATLFIAKTPDGISARQIETLIRKNGLVDKIKMSQKREFICTKTDNSEKILNTILEKNKSALESHKHLLNFLIKPEFFNWQKVFGLEGFEENLHNLKLQKDEWVSGKIIAIKGAFLILQTDNEFVSICAKDLLGKQINFADKPLGINLNSPLQGAMF